MPTLRLNNIDIHTQVMGERGPLLVMCHGLISGSIGTWYFNFAPALASCYRVVLYDMRGHGRSQRTMDGYDLDTMAADLSAVIEHYRAEFDMRDEPVCLVGHSYGALVVMQYALAHADDVRSMVILDAPLPAVDYVFPGLSRIRSHECVTQFAAKVAPQVGRQGQRQRDKLVEHIDYLYFRSSLLKDIEAAADIDDAELARLQMPVLSLYGRQSDCLAAGQRLSSLLRNIQFDILECGHYLTIEAPAEVSAAMNRFFGVPA